MKILSLTVVFLFCLCRSLIGDVIDFEDLPNDYFFLGGSQNIGSFYTGVILGPDVTALSVTLFGGFDSLAFPTHSGDVAIWSPFEFDIAVQFAVAQEIVGVWYTSLDFLLLSASDGSGLLLGSVVGNPNTDGFLGASDFLSFSAPNIASVILSGAPGLFVLDDLTFKPVATAVPEPSAFALSVYGLLILFSRKRSRNRQ